VIVTKLVRSVSVSLILLLITTAVLAQVPSSKHVILVIDENHSFSDVMSYMPWLVAQGEANGYATNYKSDNGGSLLDYLWLASGSCHSSANCTLPKGTHDFHCSGNDCFYPGTKTSDPITDDNIFRELNNAGISWKVYAQSYAAAGGKPTTPDNSNGTSYYRRHNGATWYSDILSNVDESAKRIVDLSQLATDLANGALPRYAIIVPDGNHDAHDCPVGMKTCTGQQQLAAADKFLSSTLTPILSSPDFQPGGDGLIFVTFDECAGGTDKGCGSAVYAGVIGPKVIPHTVSGTAYKHENTLRTMLDALGITTYPGAAATVKDMSDFFTANKNKPAVVIAFPEDGSSVSSPVALQASATPIAGHSISGWYVYVDGAAAYHAGATDTINISLTMSDGEHTVLVRAWDTSGAFGDQTISLNVGAAKPSVTVSAPANHAEVGSPVNVVSSASPTSGHSITGWWVYVDGAGVYNAGAVDKINTDISIGAGEHSMLVRVWDSSGAYGDQTLTITVSNKPAVAVSEPLTGSEVNSPIHIQASATPGSGQSISGWRIYVDGAGVYKGGAAPSIDAKVTASIGTHNVLVRAWDTSGAYGDQTLSLQVAKIAVNISKPANGASVQSPVNIQAGASSTNSITGWYIYVDKNPVYSQKGKSSINADVSMSSGTHTVLVRAWDSTGAYGDQTISVKVP